MMQKQKYLESAATECSKKRQKRRSKNDGWTVGGRHFLTNPRVLPWAARAFPKNFSKYREIRLVQVVNLLEFVCSSFIPAIFIQALALHNLQVWQYYLYLFLYDLFFMLDDLIIFMLSTE